VTSLLYALLIEYHGKKKFRVPLLKIPFLNPKVTNQSILCAKRGPLKKTIMIGMGNKKIENRKVHLRSKLDHYLEEDVMTNIAQFGILEFSK